MVKVKVGSEVVGVGDGGDIGLSLYDLVGVGN